jgi:hypothetical protein
MKMFAMLVEKYATATIVAAIGTIQNANIPNCILS